MTPSTPKTLPEVAAFLLGEGPLEGAHFGEKHPTHQGNFWWRKHLRAALAAQPLVEVQEPVLYCRVDNIMDVTSHPAAKDDPMRMALYSRILAPAPPTPTPEMLEAAFRVRATMFHESEDDKNAAAYMAMVNAAAPVRGLPLTEGQIEDFAKELPWQGFRKDANDEYTIPVINGSTMKLIRKVEAAHGICSPAPAAQPHPHQGGDSRDK